MNFLDYVIWELKDISPEDLTTAERHILSRARREKESQPKVAAAERLEAEGL